MSWPIFTKQHRLLGLLEEFVHCAREAKRNKLKVTKKQVSECKDVKPKF